MINWQPTEKTASDKKLPSLPFFEKKIENCALYDKRLYPYLRLRAKCFGFVNVNYFRN